MRRGEPFHSHCDDRSACHNPRTSADSDSIADPTHHYVPGRDADQRDQIGRHPGK